MYTFPDGTLRPRAARYGIRSVHAAVYTARVCEHVHGCVWDVYTTVYMARYVTAVYTAHGPYTAHGLNVPSRPVLIRGRVGLPAMYTTVYWSCTRTCTWRVHGLLTAV